MSFEHLMKSVADKHNLGELDFRDNRYFITIDGHMEVACFQANGRFYIYAVIAALPEKERDRDELLQKLLQKSLGLAMTQRVNLCIEPDSDALALYLTRPLQGLNEDIIEESLGMFANNHEFFLKQVHEDVIVMPSAPTMIMP